MKNKNDTEVIVNLGKNGKVLIISYENKENILITMKDGHLNIEKVK